MFTFIETNIMLIWMEIYSSRSPSIWKFRYSSVTIKKKTFSLQVCITVCLKVSYRIFPKQLSSNPITKLWIIRENFYI